MPRLRYTNGAVVEVPKEKVESLLRQGFTAESEKSTTTTTSRTSSSKTKK